ncbi:ABC transporter ATP-binding protein, partial [Kitasatospora sp. NPDC093558]
LVRTPDAQRLRDLLAELPGVDVERAGEAGGTGEADRLEVTGTDSERIGRLAAAHSLVLFELTPKQASLEEAFMELTKDAVEYQAVVTPAQPVKEMAA